MIPLVLLLAFQDPEPKMEEVPDPFFFVRDGEVCELATDEWGGKYSTEVEDAARLQAVGDRAGIEKAVQKGSIVRIPAGTQVLVIEALTNSSGVLLSDIRVKGGPLKDQRLFVPRDSLVRKVQRRALTEDVKKEIFGTYVPLLTKNQKVAKQIAAKTSEVKDPVEPTKLSIRKKFLLTDKELASILQEGVKERWPKTYRKPRAASAN